MDDDDQYREYGSSERTAETPGYFRSMVMALSGARADRPIVEVDDEDLSQEDLDDNLLPTMSESVLNEEVVSPKSLKVKVTDNNFVKDNSSDSSGRISTSRPNLLPYGLPEVETYVRQTDFRDGPALNVGLLSHPGPTFPNHLVFSQEESSGGENYVDGNFSVRRSIGSIHNVTKRESKRTKDRPVDREYRRNSLPNSLALSHVQSRVNESTPAPDGAGEYAWRTHGHYQSVERHASASNDQGNPPAPGRSPSGLGISTDPDTEVFIVHLVFQGNSYPRKVWRTMSVSQLVLEASALFDLDPATIVLMLFGMHPVTLDKSRTLAGPPPVPSQSTIMVFQVFAPSIRGGEDIDRARSRVSAPPRETPHFHNPIPYSKLLGTFKLPKFDGTAKNWKAWDRAFRRFLGLHDLDHVLNESFLSRPPLSTADFNANKIVYFLVEDAVSPGTLAAKYIRQAALWNGNSAYTYLHNGFVFSGPQTATMLLAQLSNLRFLRDETGSAFCLRLVEIIEDLEMIPGKAAIFMTDTQKLGYLLSAIRHEKDLQGVYVQLQSEQLRGLISFDQACQELHHRCEAMRADELLDRNVVSTNRALLSTTGKKKGKDDQKELAPCLVQDCASMIVSYLPLCKSCYLQCTAGKTPSINLRDGLGIATYNVQTQRIDFPQAVPVSRLPEKKGSKGKSKQKSRCL
jgi:hypothetical protein